jgi:hypothetical protein
LAERKIHLAEHFAAKETVNLDHPAKGRSAKGKGGRGKMKLVTEKKKKKKKPSNWMRPTKKKNFVVTAGCAIRTTLEQQPPILPRFGNVRERSNGTHRTWPSGMNATRMVVYLAVGE